MLSSSIPAFAEYQLRSHLLRVYRSLHEAVTLLAETPEKQIRYLQDNAPGDNLLPTDELVLMLDDVRDAEVDLAASGLISVEAANAVAGLRRIIEDLSNEPDHWSLEALVHGASWARLRVAADLALKKLPPPPKAVPNS